jgi:hypothetical protein
MRWLFVLVLAACGDDGGGGGGVTSSVQHLEGPLPLADNVCFTEPLLDVQPTVAGDQYDCTALLDGSVLSRCGASEPCWEIVPATNVTCMHAPSVRGGNDGQILVIDCVVEQ